MSSNQNSNQKILFALSDVGSDCRVSTATMVSDCFQCGCSDSRSCSALHICLCVFPGSLLAVVVVSVVLGTALLALVISSIVYVSR